MYTAVELVAVVYMQQAVQHDGVTCCSLMCREPQMPTAVDLHQLVLVWGYDVSCFCLVQH